MVFSKLSLNHKSKEGTEMEKKHIAWSANKILYLYLLNTDKNPFSYCVDSFSKEDKIKDVPIFGPSKLEEEDKDSVRVVIFAVSNTAMRQISSQLNTMGFRYGDNYVFFSDFLLDTFREKFSRHMGWYPDMNVYTYALSFNLNSIRPIHTSVLGTLTFLECMKETQQFDGQIAEVGAFECGNVLCALNFAAAKGFEKKNFYAFDSFEGFADLSEHDPVETRKKGDYRPYSSLQEIYDSLKMFPQARIIKGFVPDTFKELPDDSRFSLVFYDADLYQPAVDTFEFVWDRIVDGGYLIMHDYEYEPGGFMGVRKAAEDFFSVKDVSIFSFFENTMGIIKK